MRYKAIIIAIAIIIFGGFNNTRELNDLAIVSSIAVDKSEDGKYIVSAQISNPSKSSSKDSSGNSNEIVVYESNEKSIQLALRNMILESPKRLYLAHMELLIISEKIAKEDLQSTLDFFVRDNEGSNDFMMLVARNCSPLDVLKLTTPLEPNPTTNIKDSVKAVYRYKGTTTKRVLSDTLEDLMEIGRDTTLASVTIDQNEQEDGSSEDGDMNTSDSNKNKAQESKDDKTKGDKIETKERILISDMAYFKDDKMLGYLEEKDNISYNIVKNSLLQAIVQYKAETNEKIVVEIIKSSTEIKPKYENGNYIMDINVNCVGNITEIGLDVNLENSDDIKEAQNKVSEIIKNMISEYVYNCQNVYKSDLLGYGEIFHKKLTKEFKNIKNIFMEEHFSKVITNINVSINFPNEGGIIKEW